jgi:AcrR family transcriptional regulator
MITDGGETLRGSAVFPAIASMPVVSLGTGEMEQAATRIRKEDLAEARTRMYRDLVFRAAEKVFAAKGFRDSRMEDIAAEAGISLRTLYATYRGKKELYRQIEETRIGQLFASVVIDTGLAPLPRLLAVVRCYLTFLTSHPAYLRMHLRQGQSWAVQLSDGPQNLEGRIELGVPELEKIFREGMQDGTFFDGDPEVAARLMLASQQILLADWVRRGASGHPEAILETVITQIERSFVAPRKEPHDLTLAARA